MTTEVVARYRTALTRTGLSRPLTTALTDGLIDQDCTVFDYGCGKGDDIRHLRALGYNTDGWDPTHRPDATTRPCDVVNLGYVINVIERPDERVGALRAAWELTHHLLI